nr:tetraspanin [Hymenolepis microstoma]
MGGSCIRDCQIYVLYVLNGLLVLIGLTLLGLSIFAYMEPGIQSVFLSAGILHELQILLIVLICTGVITVIVAILGCCGVYHESPGLLGIYSICIAIVICVEVAIGVLSFLYQSEIEEKLTQALKEVIRKWMSTSKDLDTEAQNIVTRDVFQSTFECCGEKNYEEYRNTVLPTSCCPETVSGVCDSTAAFTVGCYDKASEAIRIGLRVFTANILAMASYEMVGLIFILIFYFTVIRHYSGSSYVSVARE